MGEVKGVADAVGQFLYETFAVAVPGAVLLIGAVAVLSPASGSYLLEFASGHPVLSLVASYVAGYVIQGISRPVTATTTLALQVPTKVIALAARSLVGAPTAARITHWLTHTEEALTGRPAVTPPDGRREFQQLAGRYWKNALRTAQDLPPTVVRDLSFSAIAHHRSQLDRFRAAASGCRGLATVAALMLWTTLCRLLGDSRFESSDAALVVALLGSYYALQERSRMYSQLWERVLETQFLASTLMGARGASDPPPTDVTTEPLSPLATSRQPESSGALQ